MSRERVGAAWWGAVFVELGVFLCGVEQLMDVVDPAVWPDEVRPLTTRLLIHGHMSQQWKCRH